MTTLCLGDAHVGVVAARSGALLPQVGGGAARACEAAARRGAAVALAGAAPDDLWGRWLRARLRAAGVDLAWFAAAQDGAPTAVAFALGPVGADYGEPAPAPAPRDAVEATDALLLGGAALEREATREAALEAHEHALRLGRPVVLLPELRPARWPSPGAAASAVRGLLDGLLLLVCDRAEALALTGEHDPERAARGLLAGGVRHALLLLGEDGALLRGERGLRARAPGPATSDTAVAAGAAVAALGRSGFYPPALAAALAELARP